MRIGTFSLAAFFLFCLALNILTLYNGHNWGGDFAQYLIHAQNLLSHRPYTAGIMLEQNIIYPPGFPLLLAPWIQFWGVNFILLKTLNIFCWIGALLFLHRLAKEHTDRSMALLCTMLLSVSSVFFVFKQNILSDMPFMFFILGGLCLIQSRQWAWALIFIYWAILTRSAGLVLSLSAIFYFAWIQRDNLKTWTITLVTIVALGTQLWITRGIHPAFFKALSVNPAQTVQFLLQYAPTVWQSLAWFYAPGQTTFTSGIFLLFSWVLTITAPILWIGLIFFGIKKCLTRKISLIECFCFLYLLLLFFWSYFGDSPQQFNRFLFPIVGLIPLLFYHALKDAASHHILKVAMVIFILINAINTLGNINFNKS